MHIAKALPSIATRNPKNAFVLVLARGNTTSTTASTSHTKRDGTSPLTPGGSNFGTYMTERAQKFEHKDLLVCPSEDLRKTFLEVQKRVDAFAVGLREMVIKEDHTFISTIPDNSINLYLQLASARSNIVYIPFTPTVPLPTFLEELKASKARGFIVPDFYGNRNYILDLYHAIPEVDLQREDVPSRFHPLEYPELRLCALWSKEGKQWHGFKAINNFAVTHPFRSPIPKMVSLPNDKTVLLLPQNDTRNFDAISQVGLVNTGHSILEALAVSISDRISLAAPYNSIGYFLAAGSISHGAVLIHAGSKFSAEATLKTIIRDKSTILFITASNLSALQSQHLAHNDLSSLRTVVIWGELDANIIQQATSLRAKEIFGIGHVDGHTGQLTGLIYTAADKAIPLPSAEAKVVDAQGKVVPLGTKGTIKTKGPHVLAAGQDSDGWLDTKIQGELDGKGVLTIRK